MLVPDTGVLKDPSLHDVLLHRVMNTQRCGKENELHGFKVLNPYGYFSAEMVPAS